MTLDGLLRPNHGIDGTEPTEASLPVPPFPLHGRPLPPACAWVGRPPLNSAVQGRLVGGASTCPWVSAPACSSSALQGPVSCAGGPWPHPPAAVAAAGNGARQPTAAATDRQHTASAAQHSVTAARHAALRRQLVAARVRRLPIPGRQHRSRPRLAVLVHVVHARLLDPVGLQGGVGCRSLKGGRVTALRPPALQPERQLPTRTGPLRLVTHSAVARCPHPGWHYLGSGRYCCPCSRSGRSESFHPPPLCSSQPA